MKTDKQSRTALNLIMIVALVIAAPALVSGQEAEPDERPKTSGGCSDLTGTWKTGPKFVIASGERKRLTDAVFTWELTMYTKKGKDSAKTREELALESIKGDTYRVRESPRSNAFTRRWAELVDGNLLRLKFSAWDAGELYDGFYECKLDANCQASVPPCKMEVTKNGEWIGTAFEIVIKRQQ